MKTPPGILTAFFTILALSSSARAVDFVRQIQLIEGQTVVYDTAIATKTGDLWSKPVEGSGSIFQLYAYKDDSLSALTLADANLGTAVHANVSLDSHLVDISLFGLDIDIFLGTPEESQYLPLLLAEKTVGTYIPQATLVLSSADPHYPPRTRADQPYQASFQVAKLPPPGMELPAGAPRTVSIEQSYKLYHPTLYLPATNGSGQGRYSTGLELSSNGIFTIPGIYQKLPGYQPTRATGEETFKAFVKTGSSGAQTAIGSATIQIWPVSKAAIQGIPADARFTSIPTGIQAELTNLYPDSITYARIYSGEPRLGADGSTIGSSVISHNTYSPQNAVVPVTGLEDYVTTDGKYTIEVVTITPFYNRQPERLAYTSFTVDRTIEVNSMMSTMND